MNRRVHTVSLLLGAVLLACPTQAQVQQATRQRPVPLRTADDQTVTVQDYLLTVDSLSLTLPVNRRDSSSSDLTLPVLRYRSHASTPPVFWLGGGPGQSNLGTVRYAHFLGRHDQVAIGYRGVDGSVDLECPEVVAHLKQGGDYLEASSIRRTGLAFQECAARLETEGIDVRGFTVLDVVDDMEAARQALGYGRIHLLGESFGSRIAYLYALRYPQHVARMVLMGANPPGRMVWDPYLSDDVLRHYADLWSSDSIQAQRCPDLVAAVRNVNATMPRRWLGMRIHPGNVKAAAFSALSERSTAPIVFDTYCAAANGDASGLWFVSFASRFIFPGVANWGENASKAVSVDYSSGVDYLNTFTPPDAILGAPLGRFLWGPMHTFEWPVDRVPPEYRQVRDLDTETLLLNGSLDFTTPWVQARDDLLPHLPNGRQMIFREAGHIVDLWNLRPGVTASILTSFLETGTPVPGEYPVVPMTFGVRWGLPRLAKVVVVGILLVVALLTAITIWIVGRSRRRRRFRPYHTK